MEPFIAPSEASAILNPSYSASISVYCSSLGQTSRYASITERAASGTGALSTTSFSRAMRPSSNPASRRSFSTLAHACPAFTAGTAIETPPTVPLITGMGASVPSRTSCCSAEKKSLSAAGSSVMEWMTAPSSSSSHSPPNEPIIASSRSLMSPLSMNALSARAPLSPMMPVTKDFIPGVFITLLMSGRPKPLDTSVSCST